MKRICLIVALLCTTPLWAATYYVDPVDGNDSNTGGSGDPFLTISKAITTTGNNDAVVLAPGVYRERSVLEETNSGVTIECQDCDSADDAVWICCRDTTTDSLTVTKTAGRTNIYQFSPGARIHGLAELGLTTDLNRPYPGAIGTAEYRGAEGYYFISNTNRFSDYWEFWSGTVNTSGTTVDVTSGADLTLAGSAYWANNKITIDSVDYTVSSVTDADTLELTTSAGTNSGVSATMEHFDSACPTPGTECEPPNIGDCLDLLDNIRGAVCQDDDDYGTTWVVYVNPYLDNAGDPRTSGFRFEYTLNNDVLATFTQDNTTINKITFINPQSMHLGDQEPGQHSGNALEIGGDNSSFTNFIAFGQVAINGDVAGGGMSGFVMSDCLVNGGLSGDGTMATTNVTGGFSITDCVFRGRITTINWDGPWGDSDGTADFIFARNIIHDGGETRRTMKINAGASDYNYNWADGSFGAFSRENGLIDTNETTHLVEFEDARDMTLRNNIITCSSDSLRLLDTVGPIKVLNNLIRCGLNTSQGSADNSIAFWNNVIWGEDKPYILEGGALDDGAEFSSSGNNYILDHGNSDIGTYNPGDDFTLAELQAACSCETGTVTATLSLANLDALFIDPNAYTGATTGGDDYRPESGGALVAAGDDTNCGHTPISTCEIGPYELTNEENTGPWPAPRPWGENITISATPAPDPTDGYGGKAKRGGSTRRRR